MDSLISNPGLLILSLADLCYLCDLGLNPRLKQTISPPALKLCNFLK